MVSVRLVLERLRVSINLVQCVPELSDDFDHRSTTHAPDADAWAYHCPEQRGCQIPSADSRELPKCRLPIKARGNAGLA